MTWQEPMSPDDPGPRFRLGLTLLWDKDDDSYIVLHTYQVDYGKQETIEHRYGTAAEACAAMHQLVTTYKKLLILGELLSEAEQLEEDEDQDP